MERASIVFTHVHVLGNDGRSQAKLDLPGSADKPLGILCTLHEPLEHIHVLGASKKFVIIVQNCIYARICADFIL